MEEPVRDAPSFDTIGELDVLLHICNFVEMPKDLGRLACASSVFGRKSAWACESLDGNSAVLWSVVEESARRWVRGPGRLLRVPKPVLPQEWISAKFYSSGPALFVRWIQYDGFLSLKLGGQVSADTRKCFRISGKCFRNSGTRWSVAMTEGELPQRVIELRLEDGKEQTIDVFTGVVDVDEKAELAATPGRSWLRYMQDKLVPPARFALAHEDVVLSEHGGVATRTTNGDYCSASSGTVLCAGRRHFAVFTVLKQGCGGMFIGVVDADYDVRHARYAHKECRNCFFGTEYGLRYPGGCEWQGSPDYREVEEGDRIGLLLDTINGSLVVYHNTERLGVIQRFGLTGSYRWAVCFGHGMGCAARIVGAPMPAENDKELEEEEAEEENIDETAEENDEESDEENMDDPSDSGFEEDDKRYTSSYAWFVLSLPNLLSKRLSRFW